MGQLEKSMQETSSSLDALLERFGEDLLSRITEKHGSFGDVDEYFRLKKDMADSGSAVLAAEDLIRRHRELEEKIEKKEQENRERAKELTGIYRKLGRTLLEDGSNDYHDFVDPFREQANDLLTKVESLEDRFAALNQKEGNNVFAWIGKSTQSLVLRSFLTKAQENLDQLYLNIGEKFFSPNKAAELSDDDSYSVDNASQVDTIKIEVVKNCMQARVVKEELTELMEEEHKILAGYDAEGNPLKQIQVLKKHISKIKADLCILYIRFGSHAVSLNSAPDLSGEEKQFIASLIIPEDNVVLENAARLSGSIKDYELRLGKLRASLVIDEEKEKIEKYRKSIADKKLNIVKIEKSIFDLEEKIKGCEKNIDELQKLL